MRGARLNLKLLISNVCIAGVGDRVANLDDAAGDGADSFLLGADRKFRTAGECHVRGHSIKYIVKSERVRDLQSRQCRIPRRGRHGRRG